MCCFFLLKNLVQPDPIFSQLKEFYQVTDNSRGKVPILQLFLYLFVCFFFLFLLCKELHKIHIPYQDLTEPNILILVLFSDIEQFREDLFTGRKRPALKCDNF